MSRGVVVINSDDQRERLVHCITGAVVGTRVEIKDPKRTLPQTDRMWAMLGDVAKQSRHNGRTYNSDQWKCLFLYALGREVQFLPSLDNKTFIPYGQSSSDLSKEEMSELIDFMEHWGAENGVVFHTSRKVA